MKRIQQPRPCPYVFAADNRSCKGDLNHPLTHDKNCPYFARTQRSL